MGQPSKIMLIRHAEKPHGKHRGVTEHGNDDPESLIVQGWQRAGALVVLFAPTHGDLQHHRHLARPATIFASAPTNGLMTNEEGQKQPKAGSKSRRPLETVVPLAAKLGIAPNTQFTKGQEHDLVQAALATDGAVLISWQHEAIPDIAEAVVRANRPDAPIPSAWPDDRFDVVWVLTPPAVANGKWGFDQVPQELLAGDRSSVIA